MKALSRLSWGTLATAVLLSCATVARADHVPGEILISPAPQRSAQVVAVVQGEGLKVLASDSISGLMRVEVEEGTERARIAQFAARADVRFAELNGIGQGGLAPNDTHYPQQWHLNNAANPGADISAEEAWEITTGVSTTVVAVLDSGIDSDHPELIGRIDPDGVDFVNDDLNPEDDHGHGTWASGCIAGRANNSFGVAGVDFACRILPIKVLNANNGGTTFNLVRGINYAANEADCRILSMSLINYPAAQSIDDALAFALAQGKILIACAGNGGIGDADDSYPGASPHTISIGATTNTDARAGFSGTGDALDFVAPGQDIATVAYNNHNDVFHSVSGCSFATPITAGVVALMLAVRGDLTHSDVYAALMQGAEDEVGPAAEDTPGRDDFFGFGRINAAASLQYVSCMSTTVLPTLISPLASAAEGAAGKNRTNSTLNRIRSVRDHHLRRSAAGRRLTRLYYQYGFEAQSVLAKNPVLAVKTARLLLACVNAMQVEENGDIRLPHHLYAAGLKMFGQYEAASSQRGRPLLAEAKRLVTDSVVVDGDVVVFDFRRAQLGHAVPVSAD